MYKDNQDRIDAYLRGEMSQKERAEFESDLKTDNALHNDFIAIKNIVEALADRKVKLDMMTQWDAEEKLRLKILHQRKLIRRWTIGISAAACIAIGIFTVRPMIFTTSPSPTSDFLMPNFGNETYYRGRNNSIEYLDSLIKDRKYEISLACADSLLFVYSNELKQYKAIDSLTEKEEANMELCEEVLEDLEWRRANLLIVLGKTTDAKKSLKNIVDSNGTYKTQADSLLKAF